MRWHGIFFLLLLVVVVAFFFRLQQKLIVLIVKFSTTKKNDNFCLKKHMSYNIMIFFFVVIVEFSLDISRQWDWIFFWNLIRRRREKTCAHNNNLKSYGIGWLMANVWLLTYQMWKKKPPNTECDRTKIIFSISKPLFFRSTNQLAKQILFNKNPKTKVL